jgi:drug/metabolite transporter (DMT)-like permease
MNNQVWLKLNAVLGIGAGVLLVIGIGTIQNLRKPEFFLACIALLSFGVTSLVVKRRKRP